MAKLRNADSDVGKMAQYLARKCVIHSPQAELDMADNPAFKGKRFGKNRHYEGSTVYMVKRSGDEAKLEPNEFIAVSPGGRAMKVTVEEVNPLNYDKSALAGVGS